MSSDKTVTGYVVGRDRRSHAWVVGVTDETSEHNGKNFTAYEPTSVKFKPGEPVNFEISILHPPGKPENGTLVAVNVKRCFGILVIDGSKARSESFKSLHKYDAVLADTADAAAKFLAHRKDLAAVLTRWSIGWDWVGMDFPASVVFALGALELGLRVVIVIDDVRTDNDSSQSISMKMLIGKVFSGIKDGRRRNRVAFVNASECLSEFADNSCQIVLNWERAMGVSGMFLELGAIAARDFFEFLDRWIESLPKRGKQPIRVKGVTLVAQDLTKPPYMGALLQAHLEDRFGKQIEEWAKNPGTTQEEAADILGENFVGIADVEKCLGITPGTYDPDKYGSIPFPAELLRRVAGTHALFFGVPSDSAGKPLTIARLAELFPRNFGDYFTANPLEDHDELRGKPFFAAETLKMGWYLVRTDFGEKDYRSVLAEDFAISGAKTAQLKPSEYVPSPLALTYMILALMAKRKRGWSYGDGWIVTDASDVKPSVNISFYGAQSKIKFEVPAPGNHEKDFRFSVYEGINSD